MMVSLKQFRVRLLVGLCWLGLAVSTASAQIQLRFEAPGVQTTTVIGASVSNFNSLTPGTSYSTIAMTGVGITGPSGTFSVAAPSTTWVTAANQFGGAGGTGNFLLAGTGGPSTFTLNLSENSGYVGFWLSAMDAGNQVEFFRGSTLVGSFNADLVTGSGLLTTGTFNPNNGRGGHQGNPTSAFRGDNPNEYYAFLNFYAENDASRFDRVVFTQLNASGLEIDNVSAFSAFVPELIRSGTNVGDLPVPEPLGMTALGLGVVAVGAWLRRQSAAIAA